jgi:hypothetical protein
MQKTEPPADPAVPEPAPAAEAEARARAYLDRWERHLVRVALEGPVPAPRPPAG